MNDVADAYRVVRDFEAALCDYTGASYAVSTSSCTMALLLAVAWCLRERQTGDTPFRQAVEIPRRTYCSVPMSIWHAGGRPVFRDEDWVGAYQLKPLPVWDCARIFTGGMYAAHGKWFDYNVAGQVTSRPDIHTMMCVSFHASKTLGDTQGGAILHDDPQADGWLRRMRFDGRTEGVVPSEDDFREIGWHCYMSPDVAARLLVKLSVLPEHNAPLPNDNYPNLSRMKIFS